MEGLLCHPINENGGSLRRLKPWLLNLWRKDVPTKKNRDKVDRIVMTEEVEPARSGMPDTPGKKRKM